MPNLIFYRVDQKADAVAVATVRHSARRLIDWHGVAVARLNQGQLENASRLCDYGVMDRTLRYDLSRATDRALRHVEVSAETGCTPDAFARALRSGRADDASRLAVALFLDDGEPDAIVEIVAQEASTFAMLARLARDLLPSNHPTTAFLEVPPA